MALAALATLPWIRSCHSDPNGDQPAPAAGVGEAETAIGTFDAARAFADLERQVRIGPRPAGTPGAELARVHIEETLRPLGLEPYREAFTKRPPRSTGLDEVHFANVVVDLPPTDDKAPWLLVGAHYDTKRATPDSGLRGDVLGANDGASGVALLLELARLLVASGPRPVGYRLVFFDGEESFRWNWIDPDNRYGSRHHAANLVKSGQRDRFAAMVLVDMVADRELDLVYDLNSTGWLIDLFFDTARELGHGAFVGSERLVVADDHLSFREIGLPVVDLIDLNYPDRSNRYWHSDDDTLENVSAESLGIVGEIVTATLPKLELRVLARH